MSKNILTVWDLEDLHYIAEEVIVKLRYEASSYDDEGNYIPLTLSGEDREDFISRAIQYEIEHESTDYLNFRENEELRRISFSKALDMPLETIKEIYLKDVLAKARNILRKDSMFLGCVPSPEIPDSYLDDLLALRWRENLKLWTIQWEDKERDDGSEEDGAE